MPKRTERLRTPFVGWIIVHANGEPERAIAERVYLWKRRKDAADWCISDSQRVVKVTVT